MKKQLFARTESQRTIYWHLYQYYVFN